MHTSAAAGPVRAASPAAAGTRPAAAAARHRSGPRSARHRSPRDPAGAPGPATTQPGPDRPSAHSTASDRSNSSSARAVKHRYNSPRNPASTRRARSASGRSPPQPPVRAILEDTATASIARCLSTHSDDVNAVAARCHSDKPDKKEPQRPQGPGRSRWGTPLWAAPRADPSERDYRTGLPSRVPGSEPLVRPWMHCPGPGGSNGWRCGSSAPM